MPIDPVTTGMVYTLADNPTTWFKTSKQARQHFDEKLLKELGESMLIRQLQPVGARTDGTLIWGERRLRAAILVRKPTLLTLVSDKPISETEAKIFQLTENIQRENLSAYEIWQAASELMLLNPGWSKRDLAEALRKDQSYVPRILAPDNCVEAVREQLRLGNIGIKACYEISKDPTPDGQLSLLAKALGGSADDVAREGRKRRSVNAPAVRTDRLKIERPTGNSITVQGDSLDLEGIADELTAAAKDARKALAEGWDAKTWAAVCRDKSKAGA